MSRVRNPEVSPPRRGDSVRLIQTPVPWLGVLLLLYLLAPIAAFIVRLAGSSSHQLSSPGTASALAVSVETASITSAVAVVLGVPLAYLLSRGRSRTSSLVGVLVQLPLALPPLMSGILLLYVVGPYTFVGRLFGGRLTDNRTGIVLAQLFVAAPFLIVAARASFAAVDPALEDVAATLGHGPLARFARVAIPAALPGIGAGFGLAWLRAFGEFGATVVLAYHPYSLPVLTYVQFGSIGLNATLLPTAAALGASVIVVILLASGRRIATINRRSGVIPTPTPPAIRALQPLYFDLGGRLGTFAERIETRQSSSRLAIVGPSGAGKTFALRMLAGLAPSQGPATIGLRELSALPAEQRRVGYLPQDAALFPHLDVWGQVTFARGANPGVAAYWLDRLGLTQLSGRRPDQLSGGQRRRVSLARALVREPDLLLLDEPFSGLDTPVRDALRLELADLQAETNVTTVIVTHDAVDALYLSDYLLVVDDGRVVQQGPTLELRDAPANATVARLLGVRNVLRGYISTPGSVVVGGLICQAETPELPNGSPVTVRLSTRGFILDTEDGTPATIHALLDLDTHIECHLVLDDGTHCVAALLTWPAGVPTQPTRFRLRPGAVTCWPA